MAFRKIVLISMMLLICSLPTASALDQETIKRRDLVIDLGDGLETDAQLTYPAKGDGPFPGVILIHGSGNLDMDSYLPPSVTGTGEPVRFFLTIAEYLSERGFAVLRYNKRGVGLESALLDPEVYFNSTFQLLKQDAEAAIRTLQEQEEVNPDDIIIIGHSEGSIIAPRIAAENPAVKKLVLLSAVAHNLRDILIYQIVDRRVDYFEQVLDGDDDGLVSIDEVLEFGDPDLFAPVPDWALVDNSTGVWLWRPGIDLDGDGYMNIIDEFKNRQMSAVDIVASPEYPHSIWFRSHYALEPTLDMIHMVNCSILIQQGEAETQAPISEALLLEQTLTEAGHPDHTLITYPGIGHSFHPVDGWKQPLGPMQDYVLSDMAAWLKDPLRVLPALKGSLQNACDTIDEQAEEIARIQSALESSQSAVVELTGSSELLQETLSSMRTLVYISLGIALVAVAMIALHMYRKQP